MPDQSAVDSVFYYVDRATFLQLLFVMVVAHLMGKLAANDKSLRMSTITFVIMRPTYFFHHCSFGLQLDALLPIFFRSLFVAYTAGSR